MFIKGIEKWNSKIESQIGSKYIIQIYIFIANKMRWNYRSVSLELLHHILPTNKLLHKMGINDVVIVTSVIKKMIPSYIDHNWEFFCVVLLCALSSEFHVVICVLWFLHKKLCLVRLYPQLFVGGLMSYLRCLCLFTYSCVLHILCCIFVLFFFVLCTLCCQFLWIIYFCLSLQYSLTFI